METGVEELRSNGNECQRYILYMKNIIPEMENSTGLIINISSGAGREEFQSSVHTAHQNLR